MERAFRLAAITGAHVHIHHISSKAGLELLKLRRYEGLSVSCEAGPPWLYFCADDYEKYGALIRVTPVCKRKA